MYGQSVMNRVEMVIFYGKWKSKTSKHVVVGGHASIDRAMGCTICKRWIVEVCMVETNLYSGGR